MSVVAIPEGPIRDWSEDDQMSVNTPDGQIVFHRHTMGGPVYPVARLINPETDRERNVRVTFYAGRTEEVTHPAKVNRAARTEAAMAKGPTVALLPPRGASVEPIKRGRARPSIPKESDFPVVERGNLPLGDYLKACKARKKAMREAGLIPA